MWGLLYFVMQLLEKFIIKPQRLHGAVAVVWRIVTLLTVNFAWVLFNSADIASAGQYIAGMLGMRSLPLLDASLLGLLREQGAWLLLGVVFSTPVAALVGARCRRNRWMDKLVLPIAEMAVFLFAVSFVVMGAHNPFIYFNF